MYSTPHGANHTQYVPFYYSHEHSLISGFSDHLLALAAPIFAYWSLSLFFHYLDISGWKWLERYRIHESAEVQSRNLVSRTHVVWAVLFQQLLQTLLGLVVLSEDGPAFDHAVEMQRIGLMAQPFVAMLLGTQWSYMIPSLAYVVYWWAIPTFQFFAAMFFIDTWQYFLHRLMHINKFLYKQFHSWHHRLYVPYAFGSLYNHPLKDFFSTFKTVDDHCGYRLPFDPLQLMTGNNADYHDIHHQVIGIKSNFAQPFFVHWDTLLGTRMTRRDIELRRQKSDAKRQ
ncbi:hypothetical protein BD779DRAFT_1612046 [Infundibulicybe gibba]|nr:hypothetical protein BD779DRAFT_1612046 [Infundibulicybe gibba]